VTGAPRTVLHYLGYDEDAGGIVSVVRALAATGRFECVLGMNPGGFQHRLPPLPVVEFPWLAGEKIGPWNLWQARAVAHAARDWLHADRTRIFHGHSRAGLLAALWLHRLGERRMVASVNCYGRQRWFYRRAARRLGARLFWLTPEMRRYYGATGGDWEQCLPGGVTEDFFALAPARTVPGKLRLGGAGELSRWKGWELVPAALALLPAGIREQITFEHIGAPTREPDSQEYAGELHAAAGAPGLAGCISWRGAEPSSHRLLSAIDLLVVPSQREPYSMIIQEALAAGVPVLAAASGGPLDVIRPGENGWLFSSGDAGALATALEKQVRLREWTRLEVATIKRTARRAGVVADEWDRIYDEL
jgi:glycosyltransferase involved in cell wall biosynthesis